MTWMGLSGFQIMGNSNLRDFVFCLKCADEAVVLFFFPNCAWEQRIKQKHFMEEYLHNLISLDLLKRFINRILLAHN